MSVLLYANRVGVVYFCCSNFNLNFWFESIHGKNATAFFEYLRKLYVLFYTYRPSENSSGWPASVQFLVAVKYRTSLLS